MDLMEPKNDKVGLDFGNVDHFVLDEADRLLDQGFAEDMSKIHKEIVKQRLDISFRLKNLKNYLEMRMIGKTSRPYSLLCFRLLSKTASKTWPRTGF